MAENSDKISEVDTTAEVQKTEDDFDSLLDSALDDFSKVSLDKPKDTANVTEETPNSAAVEVDQMWSEMLKEALQADPNVREMFGAAGFEESEFIQDFTKIAEAAAKAIEGDSSNNFAGIVSETLKSLNESSEITKNQFSDPEQIANQFQEMGFTGEGLSQDGGLDAIPPFLQSIMQQFLSKDVLYPSIKDFVSRYPAWLEANKDSITQEQRENYTKQLELMEKVVLEFETETEADEEEVKKQRFQRIMSLLQQMQSLGQPPAELIQGDGAFDEANMPNLLPGFDPQQCSIM